MDFALSEEHKIIQQTAKDFAARVIEPQSKRWNKEKEFPVAVLKDLAKLGFMTFNCPKTLPDTAAGPVALALVIKEFARVCASTAVAVAVTNMVNEVLDNYANSYIRNKYIMPFKEGKSTAAAFALTEPQSGSDAASIKTKADETKGGFIINGTKQFITNASFCDFFLVAARTSHTGRPTDISLFVVDADSKGLTIEREEIKMGLHASSTAVVVFDDVFCPSENLIGDRGEGFKIAMWALDGGRINVAAQSCGLAEAAIDLAKDYAKERIQFNRPISEFQAIQFMIADCYTELMASWLLTLHAAWLKENKKTDLTKIASMAKYYASESANRCVRKAVQILGGYGYTGEFPVERIFRDCKVTTLYEGTSEIQKLVIARRILDEVKS